MEWNLTHAHFTVSLGDFLAGGTVFALTIAVDWMVKTKAFEKQFSNVLHFATVKGTYL